MDRKEAMDRRMRAMQQGIVCLDCSYWERYMAGWLCYGEDGSCSYCGNPDAKITEHCDRDEHGRIEGGPFISFMCETCTTRFADTIVILRSAYQSEGIAHCIAELDELLQLLNRSK